LVFFAFCFVFVVGNDDDDEFGLSLISVHKGCQQFRVGLAWQSSVCILSPMFLLFALYLWLAMMMTIGLDFL
jgi:hypothetical protein